MAEFYNPYHFIPIKQDENEHHKSVEAFDPKKPKLEHLSHHRYHQLDSSNEAVYTGRLVCKLTTKTPTVIGSTQTAATDESPSLVEPFELNNKPAIPASSLRGLISSLAEAASNSALRVINSDYQMSHRTPMGKGLGAIGMIVEVGNELHLRPLTIPPVQGNQRRYTLKGKFKRLLDKNPSQQPNLPVYLNGYRKIDRSSPPKLELSNNTFLQEQNQLDSFSSSNQEFFYADLQGSLSMKPNGELDFEPADFKIKESKRNFLIGRKASSQPSKNNQDGTRGIIRILGIEGRNSDLPMTKKHELFIPYTEEMEHWNTLPIAEKVLDGYYQLADERTEEAKSKGKKTDNELLPYSPKGRSRKEDHQNIRFKAGDLVYFDINDEATQVTKLSFSAIWRDSNGFVKDYFNPEKLSFNSKRETVTLAEQVFGFVASDETETNTPAAYASRVKFSFAPIQESQKDYYLPRATLAILASPKLPAPSMYFKPENQSAGGFIKKTSLKKDNNQEPQGRKIYLHNPQAIKHQDNWQGWHTKNPNEHKKQKANVKPLKTNQSFYFHIDFTNLNKQELGMLCYAIEPTEQFMHKLGMGKPLGIGSVKVEAHGIYYTDRAKRYNDLLLLTAKRYHASEVLLDSDLPAQYSHETKAPNRLATYPSFKTLRDDFQASMQPDIHQAISLIGNPYTLNEDDQVHYPTVVNIGNNEENSKEKEHFKWFVANEEKNNYHPQYLRPVSQAENELSKLDEY